MSTQLGQCVVCGKECHTRCGACASKGLDWMFFCGQEHQKLVWYTHKRVCGKENWEWPQLTKTEQKWIEEYAGRAEGNPFVEKMTEIMGPVGEHFAQFFSQIATGTSPLSPLLAEQDPGVAIKTSRFARQVAYQVRCVKDSPSGPPVDPRVVFKHLSTDLFGAVSFHEGNNWEAVSDCRPTPYFSNVRHRLLIFVTLLGLSYDDPMDREHLEFIQTSFEEVRSLLQKADEVIRPEANGLIVSLATLASDCLHSKDKEGK